MDGLKVVKVVCSNGGNPSLIYRKSARPRLRDTKIFTTSNRSNNLQSGTLAW